MRDRRATDLPLAAGRRAARRWPLVALAVIALAACAGPVVYREAATGRTVNCTAVALGQPPDDVEAARLVAFPAPSGTTGKDVPRPDPISADVREYDGERQCEQQLKRAGWTCLSGCR